MQTNPPSVGNNVKLDPLGSAVDSVAYKYGFINLKGVEPSLGLPSGLTFTIPNSVYYFTAFGIASSLKDSRKFTGVDNLVFVNGNLGYNNIYPTYNVDISGNLRALSAYIPNLSAVYIVPASGNNILNFNYANGVIFNTNLFSNYNTYLNNVTAQYLVTNFLSANRQLYNTIITVYQLTGAYVDHDVIIGGSVTATNVFAASSIITPFVSAASAKFNSLTAQKFTVTDTLSVGGNIYANQIYGQVQIDPFSQLYYNSAGQLSIGTNRNYTLAVRASDEYSTDSPSIPRTQGGLWHGAIFNDQYDESYILKPFFKTLNGAINYINKNGIIGNSLNIYVDNDIIEGESPVNYFTTDQSGKYSGCTTNGNLSSGFFSTEWLGTNYPHLTANGIRGGDFIWAYDTSTPINGVFSYVNVPNIDFNNIYISGRYDISFAYGQPSGYYYSTWRRYTDAPRKITFRTYVCTDPTLKYGQFYNSTPTVSAWNSVYTKSPVQGRQISFDVETNLQLANLCFEFNTNSGDSTGLVFYSGEYTFSNLTVALKGPGVYTYGAILLNSAATHCNFVGGNLGDPSVYTPLYFQQGHSFSAGTYNFGSPNYFPGYGLAIVGNYSPHDPTIINYGINSNTVGFVNVYDGASMDKNDYGASRVVGRSSQLQSSFILDGRFNASALFQIGDNARIQGTDQIFVTDNFALSSRNLFPDNNLGSSTATYKLSFFDDNYNKLNFKYIDFKGSFSSFWVFNWLGYTNWAFLLSQKINTSYPNSYININNGGNDKTWAFYPDATPPYVDITKSLSDIGKTNSITQGANLSQTKMNYVGFDSISKYTDYYVLNSPVNPQNQYTLNFYASSVR